MTQYVFGTGQIYTMPVGGGSPLRVGALQGSSVDISGDTKTLYGQYQYPLDVARGKTKIELKISTANIDVTAFNTVFFGGTVTPTVETRAANNEAGVVPSTPFQLTAANGATFVMDLGVYDVLTGNPLKQVASGPTTGQYSVSAVGVYTFASADTAKAVLLNYLYTAPTANSGSMTISNQLMGAIPRFQMVMSQVYAGKTFTLILYSVACEKLSLPFKQDDYLVSDISGQAFANSAGNIGIITTTSAVGGGG